MQNKSPWIRFVIAGPLLALFALGACSAGKPPSPPLVLPQLDRPVLVLHPTQAMAGVSIPRAAFVDRGGLPGVFVLRNGLARFLMIKVGKVHGDNLEVLSGLTGDETLILGNLADVHDGSPIKVK